PACRCVSRRVPPAPPDLELRRCMPAVPAAPASVMAAFDAKARHRKWFAEWWAEGQKKVVVKGGTLSDLHGLRTKARSMGLTTALVEDAGLTELPPGTLTCLGSGPAPD